MTYNNENITLIRTMLEAYYSGLLDAAGEARLRQLLEETAPLPADLKEERQLMRLTSAAVLSLLDEENVPEGLEETLRADIHRRAVAGQRRSWRRWLYAGAAAAVAAVMFTLAVIAPRDTSSEQTLTAQTQQTAAPAPSPSKSPAVPQPNMLASASQPATSAQTPSAPTKSTPARKSASAVAAQPLPSSEEAVTAETTPAFTDEESQQMLLLGEELAQVKQLMIAANEEIGSEFNSVVDNAVISRSACMTEVFAAGGRHTDGSDNQEYLNP